MALSDTVGREARADELAAKGFNGFDFVLVDLPPGPAPAEAHLEVHFLNANAVAELLASGEEPHALFPVAGGHRVRAGSVPGEVQVTAVQAGPAPEILVLTVRPVGDYSTYSLGVGPAVAGFDPVFDTLPFRFRPGCFTNDCSPEWTPAPPPASDPPIDYLAKDYDTFRHLLMAWLEQKVPGWQPSSEADLSQMLLSLFAAAADEISDYQDRVMNEAYLATARRRVSLARHARLMDYHVHQGNQASAWLALELQPGTEVQPGPLPADDPETLEVWAGREELGAGAEVFRGASPKLHHLLSSIPLHTWGGARPGLEAGATHADLAMASQADAETVAERIREGDVPRLLIQQHRDPATGNPAGADPQMRQLLRLDRESPVARQDPLTGTWTVSVAWVEEDRLRHAYCFTARRQEGTITDLFRFHGNLAQVAHGREVAVVFTAPGTVYQGAPGEPPPAATLHYQATQAGADGRPRWGTLCRLPEDRPLLYRDTPPRSDVPPGSTLQVTVDGDSWREVISLVASDGTDRDFAVEADEGGAATVRFGNGVHGENLPPDAVVRCVYQTGLGPDGNVGRDRVARFDPAALRKIARVWNPFDVTNGRAPEPRAQILRNVPEAYRSRQLRAITLADYRRRAEEVPGVARASARYAWTGSWRAVRLTLDPAGTDRLEPALRGAVARHLEPLRLIGEDLEIRAPRFVPPRIVVSLCVAPDVWPEDVRAVLEQELSDGYTPDGRLGFFHPDRWTFGQALHASQLLGRLQAVPGVDHVVSVSLSRFDASTPGTADVVEVGTDEIVQVHNDPDHMERGSITLDARGGRR
jgi:hypothetical protein